MFMPMSTFTLAFTEEQAQSDEGGDKAPKAPDSRGRSATSAGGERRKPPRWLFRYVVNPVMRTLLRSPLGKRLGNDDTGIMLLSFKGRKTGRVYSTPVGYHRQDGDLLVFTDDPWWRNLKNGARVKMLWRGRAMTGRAVPVTDEEEVLHTTMHLLRLHGVGHARRLGLNLPTDRHPTVQDLKRALTGRVMIRITPDQQ